LPATETEQNQNQQNVVTTKGKTAKKAFFTPKNQTLIGKIFVNTTTNLNTEENNNFKTEGNNNKTAITMLAEKFAKKHFDKKGGEKVNIYEYLLHDEHIQKFIQKNSGEHEKYNNFISRNKEFQVKKTMKLKEKVERFNEEQDHTCHGNPNNKLLTDKDIRNPDDFLKDNLKYVEKKDNKVAELRSKIVEDTNKNLSFVPVLSENTKKLAEKKIGENNDVVQRLHKGKIKQHKQKAFNPENIKRKPKHKKKEDKGLDLTNLKKDIQEIQTNVDKLYQDAKERKKNKEKPTLTLKDIYDIDNIASESSKYVFLDSFVKDFERSVCDLFFVRDNYMLSYDDYINLLHKLGFIKFDVKKQKEFEEKRDQNALDEKKISEINNSLGSPQINSNTHNNSNIQNSVIKTEKNLARGKSEKPEDRVSKKLDKEIKVVKESWKYLSKKDQEKVNTNQVLVFLAGILGLYNGEKPEEAKENTNENNIKKVEEEGKTNVDVAKSQEVEKKPDAEVKIAENKPIVESKAKQNKTDEDLDDKKTKKKGFYNPNPFNCGSVHPKKTQEAKSEEKPKKNEILLKKVVPEVDLSIHGFSAKLMNHLKFHFRYFYDNRMNFLLKEKRKFYNKKQVSQEELVFKPKLGNKTLHYAEDYRKKCKEQIKAEFNHQENAEQLTNKPNSLKLEEIYNILRLKKENELAKLKLQQNEEINKQCTFQPNALQATKSPKTNPVEVSKKLYTDAKQRKAKKEKTEDEKKEKEKIPVDFSFKPTVHPVKDEVFQANPIQNDEDVKKKVERYERARIERKLCELKKNKGVNNLKNVSNNEEIIKKEEEHNQWK